MRKKGLYCISTGIKGWRYCHIFLSCFLGLWGFRFVFCFFFLFFFYFFNNSLFLSQPGKDSSHSESQHWKALTCPQYPGLTCLSILNSASRAALGFGISKKKWIIWIEKTTDAFYASSWDCVGAFLYLILNCLGRYLLLCVFSSRMHTRGRFYHVCLRRLCIAI